MNIKIKRSLAAILALVMALSLAACGGDKGKGGADDGGDKAEAITLGKYTAVFKGYTLTKDDEGNDAMVLTYDYTNGSKDEQCGSTVYICLLFLLW